MRKLRVSILSFVLLALVMGAPAQAWKSTGHRVVAQIAYDSLAPGDRQEADRLLAVLGGLEPGAAGFSQAATWMDQLRREDVRFFDHWHYVNRPFHDGVKESSAADTDNILWALDKAHHALSSPRAGDFGRALALRVLLHLVGDVHQPLHCATRFSASLPGGDRGGNDFLVSGEVGGVTLSNLHDLWDRAGFLFAGPTDAGGGHERIRRLARRIVEAVPREMVPEWRTERFSVWVDESFRLAVRHAYAGIENGGEPTVEYLAGVREVSERRIALAGYRLGGLLRAALAAARSTEDE